MIYENVHVILYILLFSKLQQNDKNLFHLIQFFRIFSVFIDTYSLSLCIGKLLEKKKNFLIHIYSK